MRLRLLALAALTIAISTLVLAQQPPSQVTGTLDSDSAFAEVPFTLNQNTRVSIELQATDGNLDTMLYIVDSNGNILIENDDRTRGNSNSQVQDVLLSSGTYTAIATRYGVEEGDTSGAFEMTLDYQVEIAEDPSFAVSADDLLERGFPKITEPVRSPYAIYAYLGGDTNLEQYMLNDLNELESSGGSDAQVQMVALIDRSPSYSVQDGDWQSARLYLISANKDASGAVTIDSDLLADFGAVDSGKGELLAQFLVWAVTNYPAEQTLVTLSGHGGGWSGLITDDSAQSVISLPELEAAFAAGSTALGEKFDLLINESCLMASVEYFTVVSDYFRQTIASPEIVVEPSLDLSRLSAALAENNSLATVSEGLINNYISATKNVQTISAAYLSYAITDLDKFAPVTQAINGFAAVVNSDPVRYNPVLGIAYANAYKLGSYVGSLDKLDLGHFMQQIIAVTDEPTLVTAANDVIVALTAARVYGNAADIAKLYTSYFNVYFPESAETLNPRYFEVSPLTSWGQMLVNYFATISPRLWSVEDSAATYHPPVRPQIKIRNMELAVATDALPPTLALEIVGKNISTGEFIVDRVTDDGRKIRLHTVAIMTQVQVGSRVELVNTWKSGIDLSYFTWSPFVLPAVTDGTNTHDELVVRSPKQATLQGRYRLTDSDDWQEATVIFTEDGNAQSALTPTGQGTWAEISLPVEAQFQAYQSEVQSDGDTKLVPGNIYTWGGLRTFNRPTAAGDYDIGFLFKTFSGTVGFASTPITVATGSETLENAVQVDSQLGYAFQYPIEWEGTTVEDRLTFGDNNNVLTVYDYPLTIPTTYKALNAYLFYQGKKVSEPAQVLRVADMDVLSFKIQSDSGETRGLSFVRTDDNGIEHGIVLVLESTTSADLTALIDSLRTFDLPSFEEGIVGEWQYDSLPRSIAFPVPIGWENLVLRNGYRIYTPTDDTSSAMVAIGTFPSFTVAEALEQATAYWLATETVQARPYYGEHHNWETVQATSDANVARIYATRMDDVAYVYYMSSPAQDAGSLFREVFEPMVDGFAPPLTVSLSSSDIEPSRVKAALLQADTACGDLAENTFCTGRGTVISEFDAWANLPKFAKPLPVLATPALAIGESQSLDYLTRLDVGVNADGTTNSESIAVLDIGGVEVIALGGISLVNNSPLPQGQISTLTLQNLTTNRLNVRSLPSLGGVILTALDVNEPVTAIARNEDGSWVRVRAANGTIGWVSRDLLSASSQLLNLPVNSADQAYFAPMQNLEVYISDNVTDLTLANALVISVPEDAPTSLRLGINGYEMEIAPGTVIYWHADTATGEMVDFESEGVVGLFARRRPALFTSEVLIGALRAAPTNGTADRVTAIAGTAMGFDNAGAAVQAFNPQLVAVAYGALGAVRDNARSLPLLTTDQIQEVRGIQDSLSDAPLDAVSELSYNYTENSARDPLLYLQENAPDDSEFTMPETRSLSPTMPNQTNPDADEVIDDEPFGLPNWCDPGQPWGDGRCDSDDPAVRDWFYDLGLYAGRGRERHCSLLQRSS